MDPRLRLRHVTCFLETARLGSLSAAADAMRVSQPAASKTIRELEEILGRRLFDRSGRRLMLTPAGRLFQQHAGAAMIGLGRASDLVRGRATRGERLAVGALPTAATALLPRAGLAFREARPGCVLRVSTGPNWLLMGQLREGALDLVVGRMGSAKVMEGLSFHPLYAEDVAAVVRPGHPLLGQGEALARVGDYPLVLPPSGAVIAPVVEALLARQGVVAEAAFETVSLAFGRRVVQSSDAVWFISAGVVQDELEQGRLAVLERRALADAGPVGLSTRVGEPASEALAALIEALKAAAGQEG